MVAVHEQRAALVVAAHEVVLAQRDRVRQLVGVQLREQQRAWWRERVEGEGVCELGVVESSRWVGLRWAGG